jgi:type II secretory ATPase GspE/PulE/Tfp pilus assembly ATPase PilB-like protein/FixJ family two-component response regulator
MAKYADLFGRALPDVGRQETESEERPQRYSILFVDDEPNVTRALIRVFMEENYLLLTASSGTEALRILERQPVHLIISDFRMPGMNGAELLREVKERRPETIRIMLTGYMDVQSIMGAVNEGAVYKFITKPWNDDDLRITVGLALQQYTLLAENRQLKKIAHEQQTKIRAYSSLFDEDRGILGTILVKAGLISPAQLDQAQLDRRPDELIGDTLARLGLVSESRIVEELCRNQNISHIDLREMNVTPSVAKFLPHEMSEKSRILPVKLEGKTLTLAMADPSDIIKIDNIAMLTGLQVIPVAARSSQILEALGRIWGDNEAVQDGGDDLTVADIVDYEPMEEIDILIEDEESDIRIEELLTSSGIPPIIRIVNAIILESLRYRASDIHVEPKGKHTIVRYRIDGLLSTKLKIPSHLHSAVVSRIKILSKMDITERRKPQDGRITIKTGTRIVDCRVSTIPTLNGEKVVLRVLDKGAALRRIGELGLFGDDIDKVNMLIRKPQGIIVATGPTGSGKTTLLYSILSEMISATKNFETIEDPVEYYLDDANQVFVRDRIGLSFASVLRSTLRQDPDVILVGEIRDFETADVSFKAALTGHLVFTTLHTNNTVATITRLIDIGVKPYLIASAIEGVIAQRLVRVICESCKIKTPPDADLLNALQIQGGSLDEVYRGRGCGRCSNTGYSGRTGVFEIFLMSDDFRQRISADYRESDLINLARTCGMRTLLEDGIEKVRKGITTLDELLRVIGPPSRFERPCETCGRLIDIRHLYCPYCAAFKSNICHNCLLPLEPQWLSCPSCGTRKGDTGGKGRFRPLNRPL